MLWPVVIERGWQTSRFVFTEKKVQPKSQKTVRLVVIKEINNK